MKSNILSLFKKMRGCKWPNEGKVEGEEKVAFICLAKIFLFNKLNLYYFSDLKYIKLFPVSSI